LLLVNGGRRRGLGRGGLRRRLRGGGGDDAAEPVVGRRTLDDGQASTPGVLGRGRERAPVGALHTDVLGHGCVPSSGALEWGWVVCDGVSGDPTGHRKLVVNRSGTHQRGGSASSSGVTVICSRYGLTKLVVSSNRARTNNGRTLSSAQYTPAGVPAAMVSWNPYTCPTPPPTRRRPCRSNGAMTYRTMYGATVPSGARATLVTCPTCRSMPWVLTDVLVGMLPA